jgi:hypothetical protein
LLVQCTTTLDVAEHAPLFSPAIGQCPRSVMVYLPGLVRTMTHTPNAGTSMGER